MRDPGSIMMNRRKALTTAASTAFFALAQPASSAAAPPLPDSGLFQTNPEAYWKRIRSEHFLLPDWRVYLNNGSLGVPPRPVVNAATEAMTRGASLIAPAY